MKKLSLFFILLFICSCSSVQNYPKHWWSSIEGEMPSWEISPDTANSKVEVVLSKRNELGVLSNFSHTPFVFEGKKYQSVEGLWQSMKYPESKKDKRYKNDKLKFSRVDVEQMIAFEAKRAGGSASKLMKKNKVDWVTYNGKKMLYKDPKKGEHYSIIRRAMIQKILQNQNVRDVLIQTYPLKLLPDHKVSENDPPAWKYYQIYTELRELLVHGKELK